MKILYKMYIIILFSGVKMQISVLYHSISIVLSSISIVLLVMSYCK